VIVLVPGISFLYLAVMRVSQVAQGLILPPFLYFLVKLGDDRTLLGEYANPPWLSRLSWASFYILTVIDILLLGATLKELVL
jgi:Mn2+/Fe2+ NRAMP family transporter